MNEQVKPGALTTGETTREPAPKRYQTPTLTEYGSVAKLTRGTRSVNADGPGNTMKAKACL